MPRRASRKSNQHNRETRERILIAAAEVLSEEGVVGVSTRRVAERAGANQALIHYYFESIDNLMWEVVKRIAERAVVEREERYNQGGTFIDNWHADIDALLS
ncbi:MAG TPA: TetR/AcrR family transcriptional regulator, partial [Acidimicrobiales bacterium]|nr:TetR/AcrR family transcriptional regulator [Acidimicrobiales bacterium]